MSERFSISVHKPDQLNEIFAAYGEVRNLNAHLDGELIREIFNPLDPFRKLSDIPTNTESGNHRFQLPKAPTDLLNSAVLEFTINLGHAAHTIKPEHDTHDSVFNAFEIIQGRFPDIAPARINFGIGDNLAYVSLTTPIPPETQPVKLAEAIQNRNADGSFSGLDYLQVHSNLPGGWKTRLYISDHPGPDDLTKLRTTGLLTWSE